MSWLKRIIAAIKAAFRTPAPAVITPVPPTGNGAAPEDFDLAKVKWVHGAGQNIASWPILCALGAVRIELPYVITTGATWPIDWPCIGAKKVQASHVVIALIDGEWKGGCWEAMRLGMPDKRPLEGLTKPQPKDRGPFCQVERDPFWNWQPKSGDKIGFMITSWIRSHVAQPVGRSEVRWTTWPA